MILVNINKSGASAATDEQLRDAAAGAWVIAAASVSTYGDYLAAVRKNLVVGVWTITGSWLEEDGRVSFELAAAPEMTHLIGEPSPVPWKQGAANPVKLVDTATYLPPSVEVEESPRGNRVVRLDGWSMTIYRDGRARLSAPDVDAKLVVESAFPGPRGANVTVRLIEA